jgi:hypothetical protein
MMPDEYETVPQAAEFVDMPQVPTAVPWVWTTNKLVIAALSVLGVGFAIWFVMSYSSAKAIAAVGVSDE